MRFLRFYYQVKPLIPRRIQLFLRRCIASSRRKKTRDTWPINPRASKSPKGWCGWPDGKTFALILSHDVDTAKGQAQSLGLMRLESQLGFTSSFNFVPGDYPVSENLRRNLVDSGFEVGVHGLRHDGKLFRDRRTFERSLPQINRYLKEWGAVGFKSPAMHHNLDWIADFDIEYDASTFDTDPFEPQPDGLETIFPQWFYSTSKKRGYVELPYTLPQDHCLFVILKETDITIWKEKLAWIVANGGMALLNVHPDYIHYGRTFCGSEEYPVEYYITFLEHLRTEYAGQYWHPLPRELARFWRANMVRDE
jgi:hypothetical protein